MLFITIFLNSVLLIIIILIIVKIAVGKTKNKILNRINIDKKEILLYDKNANFFGLYSKGMMQWRGNCVLILTKDYLYSFFILSKNDLKIPLSNISKISVTKNFLGKSIFKNLLKIEFKNNTVNDSAAWYIHNLDRWLETISTISNKTTEYL